MLNFSQLVRVFHFSRFLRFLILLNTVEFLSLRWIFGLDGTSQEVWGWFPADWCSATFQHSRGQNCSRFWHFPEGWYSWYRCLRLDSNLPNNIAVHQNPLNIVICSNSFSPDSNLPVFQMIGKQGHSNIQELRRHDEPFKVVQMLLQALSVQISRLEDFENCSLAVLG